MPPRQKTTFDRKGRGTTTYREYNPAQERANSQLERFIRNNPAGDDRNTQQSTVQQVIADMPAKFQNKTFKNFSGTDYNDMTQAQKMIFDFYDNRNKYQRDMNNLRTSSPEMMKAYATKFPLTNFAMKMGPTIAGAMTGIPFGLLEKGFDKTKQGFNFAKTGAGQGLDAILSGIDKGMSAAESGLDRLSGDTGNMIQDTGEIIRNTGTDVKENIFAQPGDDFLGLSDAEYAQYQRNKLNQLPQRDNRINPLAEMLALNTSTDTPGIERIFKLPGDFRGDFNNQYFTGVPDRSLKENYLVRQPEINALMGMNLNQGGLASLNNPDYNRLMGASNFGF